MNIPKSQLNSPKTASLPGHWLLAQMGKRVLRPGGIKLTKQMIAHLAIKSPDKVVEFAPGLGITAQLTLTQKPASYTAIERDSEAAARVQKILTGNNQRCLVATAENTGLAAGSATVVYGEAMLSMQTPSRKQQIVGEAGRILEAGGRYGIHEMCLVASGLDEETRREMLEEITDTINHHTLPLTPEEWQNLLESQGFTVREKTIFPMHLLEPLRIIDDEGIWGALKFAGNLLRNREARERVLAMRRVFRKYQQYLGAIALVAVKN
ncbi:MAG: class I SAM-dependent methyltransferase [Oscillatoriaceae cyanobacterium]